MKIIMHLLHVEFSYVLFILGCNCKWKTWQFQHPNLRGEPRRVQGGGGSRRLLRYQQAAGFQRREPSRRQPPRRRCWDRPRLSHLVQERQRRPCWRAHWRSAQRSALLACGQPSHGPGRWAASPASVLSYCCFPLLGLNSWTRIYLWESSYKKSVKLYA